MKTVKALALVLSVLAVSGILFITASAASWPVLPTSEVTVTVTSGAGEYPLAILLSDVPAPPPFYDVTNGPYTGYCVDLLTTIQSGSPYSAILESSLTKPTPWDKINYILNNRIGTAEDVQAAIWLVLGFTPSQIQTYGKFTPSAAASQMADNANLFGGGFTPTTGQIAAVYCDVEGGQDLLIELRVPGEYSGKTPGFWKNHLSLWTGYAPTDEFNAVFGVSITIDGKTNPTLLEALQSKGGVNEKKGVYDALARHAVAALLNANHPYVNYPLTTSQIIELVQNAINNGGAEAAKNLLEDYNTLGGGIDAHGNPI